MPINFPTSPTANDVYSYAGRSWIYNGSGWVVQQANLTYSTIVAALGYQPLSVFGGTLSGNLTITTAAIVANGSPGSAGQALYSNGSAVYWSDVSTIAGTNTQVQFNDQGFANASAAFVFDKTSNTVTINGPLLATSKSFLIVHPTKEGKWLRYGSLEGPENGVYVRGRLTNKYVIELPDYWHKLIDEETITVSLTPIGLTQQPTVGSITNKTVYVIGENVDCFYHIFAERKDVEKLQVEI